MTLFLHILGTAALGFVVGFVLAACVNQPWLGRNRRLDTQHDGEPLPESGLAAVRDHLPDATEMVGAVVVIGDTPAELVSFDLKLPAGIPESEAYRWN